MHRRTGENFFHRIHIDVQQTHEKILNTANHQFSSVQSLSRVRLCDPMNRSTPGLPVHHQLILRKQNFRREMQRSQIAAGEEGLGAKAVKTGV